MEQNRKFLKIGLIIIGITLSFCLLIILYLRIDKPIFLKNYCEYPMYLQNEQDNFYKIGFGYPITLQYITNITDSREVYNVTFKDAPNLLVNASERQPFNYYSNYSVHYGTNNKRLGMGIGRYSLRSINLDIQIPLDVNQDEIELTEATLYFNNGEQMDVNIGKLILYNKHHYNIDNPYLDKNYSSHNSSTGEDTSDFMVYNDITIFKVESPLLDELNDIINIKINDYDYTKASEIQIKQGDRLKITGSINYNSNIDLHFIKYNISPNVYYKDNKGNIHHEHIYDITSPYYSKPSLIDTIKFLKF